MAENMIWRPVPDASDEEIAKYRQQAEARWRDFSALIERLAAEDARNRPALEKLIRAIEAVLPELASAPLVAQIADDVLTVLGMAASCRYVGKNPLRTEAEHKQYIARRAATIRHAPNNTKRRAVQDAWLALERSGSRKSKAKFATEQARALNLSPETIRRWLRDGELHKP